MTKMEGIIISWAFHDVWLHVGLPIHISSSLQPTVLVLFNVLGTILLLSNFKLFNQEVSLVASPYLIDTEGAWYLLDT